MTLAVVSIVLATVGVAFLVVYGDTGEQLRSGLQHDIHEAAAQLAQDLRDSHSGSPAEALAAARNYVASQPFGRSDALLFALVPGVGTASNHPELFGASHPDPGETAAEQARENAEGSRLSIPHAGFSVKSGADVGSLEVYEMRLNVAGRPLWAGAAEPLAAVTESKHTVAGSFAVAGGFALVLAILAAYFTGARITAPLRRIAGVAARVDAGELEPRMSSSRGSNRELAVLADAFNHMLDRLADAFERQREFVADASHELRTPLTVMRGQLDLLATETDLGEIRRIERMLQSEIVRITRLVDDMLLLAQSDRGHFLQPTEVELSALITELWDGLSLIAERDFVVGPVAPTVIRADPDRLAQALRNLARNAIEHTSAPDGLVRIDLEHPAPGVVRLIVTDDGPGVDPELRDRVFERFYRIDPARSRAAGGAGLGLSIVRAIATAHGGTVRATERPAGARGARFELDLPSS